MLLLSGVDFADIWGRTLEVNSPKDLWQERVSLFFFVWLMIELLRENKRMLDKSIREIERERQGLQAQEKKLIAEIKKVAKQGQMVWCAKPYGLLFDSIQPS